MHFDLLREIICKIMRNVRCFGSTFFWLASLFWYDWCMVYVALRTADETMIHISDGLRSFYTKQTPTLLDETCRRPADGRLHV